MKRILMLCSAALLSASSATAQILFQDNFNTENGGATGINYNTFANWDVTIGQVDLVKSGDYSITCDGMCVDLDGSPGGANMRLRNGISFSAGDVIRMSFDVGGSQRSRADDNFAAYFEFGGNASFAYFLGTGGLVNLSSGPRTVSLIGQ